MGSRIRSSPSSMLVCWCEVVVGQGSNQPPWIIHKFPNTFSDQQILMSIPQFVFPCSLETTVVQNFSFVLTAEDSTFTFGFCRHSPNSESALVVLSHLPWDSTFYKILHQCRELQDSSTPGDVWSFLQALYTCPVPDPGSELAFTYSQSNKMFVSKCPNHLTLPSIPDNRNLLEYINAVSPENMMVVFASLLFERRILVSSKHLHRLSACVQAANALLYPMNWQHIYIPVMPEQLLNFLLAPMPFLIGVPEVLMERVRLDEVGEFVHLNADADTVESPFRDLAELPVEVSGALRRRLNQPAQGMSDSVPRAFLRALVMLIGNYHDALQFNVEQRKVVFNMDKFVASRPSHLQPFVQKMLELQIFRQFLEERLDLVNRGSATSDEFEMEVSVHSDRPRHNYQQLFRAVKKEGGAIVKNFKSKTNPAVKSAVKSVSKGGKQVREQVKEIRDKMRGPNTRVPEQGEWGAEPEHKSNPSSPVSHRRPPSLASSVTAKASYTRPASTPHRPQRSSQRDRDSSVPPSISSSSFRSSDSPGRTPTPHTIDLVGELEKELYSRLAEPNSVSLPRAPSFSHTTAPSSRGSSLALPTVVSPAIPRPTALPPPIPNTRSNTTLGTTTTTRESSPSRHALSSTSKAASTSLTSLPAIDFSLDIELPPPITAELLPCSTYHRYGQQRTKHETEHESLPWQCQQATDDFDQSHKHYFRSPRPYYDVVGGSEGGPHYSTLPRGVPGCRESSGEVRDKEATGVGVRCGDDCMVTAAQTEAAGGGRDSASKLHLHQTLDIKRLQELQQLRDDVVSLYGTAQQFRTRMLWKPNHPAPPLRSSAHVHHTSNTPIYEPFSCRLTNGNATCTKNDDIVLPHTKHRALGSSTLPSSTTETATRASFRKEPSAAATSPGVTEAAEATPAAEPPPESNACVSVKLGEAGSYVSSRRPKASSHYLDRSVSFSACSSRPKYCVGVRSVGDANTISGGRCTSATTSSGSYSTLGRINKGSSSFPKYDASQQFSKSLAAFTSRGNNSEYFYSTLRLSRGGSLACIDNENLGTEEGVGEASDVCGDLKPVQWARKVSNASAQQHQFPQFQLGPYRGYHHREAVRCGRYQLPNSDIMTMSLPIGLTSLNAWSPLNNSGSQPDNQLYFSSAASSSSCNKYPSLPEQFNKDDFNSASFSTDRSSRSNRTYNKEKYNSLPPAICYINCNEELPATSVTACLPPAANVTVSSFSNLLTDSTCKQTQDASVVNEQSLTTQSSPKQPTTLSSSRLPFNPLSSSLVLSNSSHQSAFLSGCIPKARPGITPSIGPRVEDQDLIMLGSPQEEEFDPLLSKSLGCTTLPSRPPCSFDPPDPPTLPRRTSSSSSLGYLHPVSSFLHSNANTARPSPPHSLHPSHDLLHPLPHDSPRPSASSSSSSSSISSLHHPYLPFSPSLIDVKSPHNDASSALLGQPLGIPLLPTRTQSASLKNSSDTDINTSTNSNSDSTVNGGGSRSSTAAPLIPVPARRVANKSGGGVYRSPGLSSSGGAVTSTAKVEPGIPASTMADLPAALQHHLAAKLESLTRSGRPSRGRPFVPSATTSLVSLRQVDNVSSHLQKLQPKTVFDDPRFVPFASLQSTTTAAPTRQANPMYNAHVLPQPASAAGGANVAKPNLAAAFANSMLSDGGSDVVDGDCSKTLLANNNNNNNNIDPKILLSDFSEPFAQMKLNRETPIAGDDSAANNTNGGGASKQEVVAAAPHVMGGVNKAGWTAFE